MTLRRAQEVVCELDAADRDVKSQKAREKSSSVAEIPDNVPKGRFSGGREGLHRTKGNG